MTSLQRSMKSKFLRSRCFSLALLSLVLVLLQATPAIAQAPWTTADGSGNINSTNSGNVGIGTGTTTPSAKLHVFSDSNSAVKVLFEGGSPEFWYRRTNALTLPDGLFRYAIGPDGAFYLQRNTSSAGNFATNSNPLIITKFDEAIFGGKVAVGTTNPSEKLEVLGNIKVTGTGNITATGTIEANIIKAKYQDIAEWVPASEQIPAGTVLVLDSTKSNHVIASTKGYDTRVAGVISEQPGITLGEAGKSKVLVATTGRVRIKVDATRRRIQIGDLLVTSDVPGLAMKSEPIRVGGRLMHMPGTLIGKALEPLEKGTGEILVLLSLQ